MAPAKEEPVRSAKVVKLVSNAEASERQHHHRRRVRVRRARRPEDAEVPPGLAAHPPGHGLLAQSPPEGWCGARPGLVPPARPGAPPPARPPPPGGAYGVPAGYHHAPLAACPARPPPLGWHGSCPARMQ
eukprot:TRINITY_DN64791_c0_g1_i1.p4 TRINITY_DN64791_c0_g1~~TRINITY_DN64791_c0_g1_i1.p4  ORF type:complete len:130 (-),score=13.06 TRINITY_DN64791_c0_g1_i1:95-484(-)